jgi:predicted PurR-regulated permease PerM
MSLTLNQFLVLLLTFVAVVVATVVVVFLLQLRRTVRQAETTLEQINGLVKNLEETSRKINRELDGAAELIDASKKIATSVADITWFATTKFIRPSSKYWPIVFPILRLGWRQWRKFRRKEEKNGG